MADLSSPESDDDSHLDAFHRRWRKGRRPSMRSALRARGGGPGRKAFVRTLLSIDLEHRLDVGDAAPIVEDHLELAEAEQLDGGELLELLRQEYEGRWRRGETDAMREEYQRRFPDHAAAIDGWRPRWDCPICGRQG